MVYTPEGKSLLYYLINRACKIIKGTYLVDDNDEKADGIDKFTEVFEVNQNYLFEDESYAVAPKKKRNTSQTSTIERLASVSSHPVSRKTRLGSLSSKTM